MALIKNKLVILVTIIFLGYVGWWASFQSIVEDQGKSVQWFGGTYGFMALIGAVIGYFAAQKWGGFKTILGKALMFFSLGLLAQEAGQLIYTYYTYGAHIDVPYPSWGDAAYFGSVLLYICGGIFLAKAVGVKFSLRPTKSNIIAIGIPLALLIASYWIFLNNHVYDTSQPLTVFLDFGYPMGQAIYISLGLVAYLLCIKMLGGVMRAGILFLIFALFVQYISDWTFVYQTSRDLWIPGKFDDLFYLMAYFVMTITMIKFHLIYRDLINKTNQVAKMHDEAKVRGA